MFSRLLANLRLQILLVALLLVAGLAALASLPRTEDPRVLNRVALVLTPFPGATAERVEALVTEPLEEALRELPEVKHLIATAQPGLSVVQIELKDRITDVAPVWSRARDKVADVQPSLPAGVQPSRFDDERGYAFTRILALTWQWPDRVDRPVTPRELAILKRYGEALQTRLQGVAGTELVQLYGQPEEEILLTLDPARGAALQLAPGDVAGRVGQADAKVAAGTLRSEAGELLVEVAGELDSLERIRRVPLGVTEAGRVVRVGDLTEVERQVRQPLTELALVQGRPAVVVAVRMLPDLRIDHWSGRIDEVLTDFRSTLPGNLALETLFDQQGYTRARLGSLIDNVLLGFALILGVLLITLGPRAALVVALALPLTVLFTLAAMNLFALPIHQMSVTGLVVALGIMVDNAIVMADAIQRRRREGLSPLAAVGRSVRHLWLPLAGSTLTTLLAFAPIVLMPGPAGEFVGGIALSVIFALTGSYIISFTLVAGLGGRLLGPGTGRWWDRGGLSLPGLGRAFAGSLTWSLNHPGLSVLLVTLVPVAGFLAAGRLTEQFFPPSDRDMFHIEVYLPTHTPLAGTRRQVEAIDRVLAREAGIDSVHWFVGGSAPPFYYNMVQNRDGTPWYAQAMVRARDFREANRLIPQLQARLDRAFPQAQILVRQLEQGPPIDAPVEVRLAGPDLGILAERGEELRRLLAGIPEVVHTRSTLTSGTPKVRLLTRDEDTLLTGLPLTGVAARLQGALEGAVGGSVLEGGEELPVRVRIGQQQRQGPGDLADLTLAAPQARGAGVPVGALGELEIVPTRGLIPRRDGQRVNTVEAYLATGVLPQTVLDRLRTRLEGEGFALPAGYRLAFGGESAGRDDAVGNLLSSVGVILTLLVVVVVLSFNSFRLSALIFAVAVQSAGLGLLSVALFGYPFGFTVIIGLLGLMGLAINAAIVILAELKADPRAAAGDRAAIRAGVLATTRHIGSTTITTVGGFMPLILAGGGFWPPFATAIAGGTVLTTLLSFYLVPTLFGVLARRRPFRGQEAARPVASARPVPGPRSPTFERSAASAIGRPTGCLPGP